MKWLTIIKCALIGAIAGFAVGVVLSFFVGCESIGSCTCEWIGAFFGCGDSSCEHGCQEYTSNKDVQKCILYVSLIGTVIGCAYGTAKALQEYNAEKNNKKQEKETADKNQRVKYLQDLRTIARDEKSKLDSVRNESDQFRLNQSCCCDDLWKNGWTILKEAYETNAALEHIINELIDNS